jgi:hypothetical protein
MAASEWQAPAPEAALGGLVETLPIKAVRDTEADAVSSGNIGVAEVVTAREKRLHAETDRQLKRRAEIANCLMWTAPV